MPAGCDIGQLLEPSGSRLDAGRPREVGKESGPLDHACISRAARGRLATREVGLQKRTRNLTATPLETIFGFKLPSSDETPARVMRTFAI